MNAWITVHLKCDHCDRTFAVHAPIVGKDLSNLRIDMCYAKTGDWEVNMRIADWGTDDYRIEVGCREHRDLVGRE